MPTSDEGLAQLFDHDRAEGAREVRTPARIGPNAIIQTGQALSALFGEETARSMFDRAGIGHRYTDPAAAMLDEREPQRLFAVLCDTLSDQDATRALAEAGHRTGHYLLANRIPKLARWLLPRLPAGISARMLVRAISAHAWTFAGSGGFSGDVHGWRRPVIHLAIKANPLSTPGCPWHGAVFERLFTSLTATFVTVEHPRCSAQGGNCCEWRLRIAPGPPARARMSPKAAADPPDREDRPSQASR